MSITAHLGRWQDTMADLRCHSLITDPPFSERTHVGAETNAHDGPLVTYAHMTEEMAGAFAESWAPRVERWVVIFSDHTAFRWHEAAWKAAGWYVFAPVGYVRANAVPRMAGEGPTCSVEWMMVARRYGHKPDGARGGHYLAPKVADHVHPGQKNLDVMRAIVRDYSRSGDVVADPFSGSGTTLIAADVEGRTAIGCEQDPVTFSKLQRRTNAPRTMEIWT